MFQVPAGPSSNLGYHVGSFYVFNNGNPVYVGGANAQGAGTSFRAAVLPQCCVNPPPGGGRVSASGQSIHVALIGVPASVSYEVLLCFPTPAGNRCSSFVTNTVDVDGQGNGAKDFSLPGATFIGFVLVKNHLNQNYETGFRVQQLVMSITGFLLRESWVRLFFEVSSDEKHGFAALDTAY